MFNAAFEIKKVAILLNTILLHIIESTIRFL